MRIFFHVFLGVLSEYDYFCITIPERLFGFKTRKEINNTIEYLDQFLGTAGTTINQQTLKNISWHKK